MRNTKILFLTAIASFLSLFTLSGCSSAYRDVVNELDAMNDLHLQAVGVQKKIDSNKQYNVNDAITLDIIQKKIIRLIERIDSDYTDLNESDSGRFVEYIKENMTDELKSYIKYIVENAQVNYIESHGDVLSDGKKIGYFFLMG